MRDLADSIDVKKSTLAAVDNLTDVMAHELTTALSSARQRAFVMMENLDESDPLVAQFKELIECIEKGCQINNLLDNFSKVDAFYDSFRDEN
ncbi:MAG: hypothetical protein GY729_20210 [Desulfobacteraceae bacterium]|nr:hypothetical protein [Desulfobacteraceae bacterium]